MVWWETFLLGTIRAIESETSINSTVGMLGVSFVRVSVRFLEAVFDETEMEQRSAVSEDNFIPSKELLMRIQETLLDDKSTFKTLKATPNLLQVIWYLF